MESVLITELKNQDEPPTPPSHMQIVGTGASEAPVAKRRNFTNMDFEFDEEEKSNQIFNVKDAIPPNDFEAPYSQLPTNVKLSIVKSMVRNVYLKLMEKKKADKKDMMQNILSKSLAAAKKAAERKAGENKDIKLPPIENKATEKPKRRSFMS